jgi:hypothetical protein
MGDGRIVWIAKGSRARSLPFVWSGGEAWTACKIVNQVVLAPSEVAGSLPVLP